MNNLVVINNGRSAPRTYEPGGDGLSMLPARLTNVIDQIFHFADVTVDIGRRKITRSGEAVRFTPAEYNLLMLFLQNVDRPLYRDDILNAAWGYDFYPKSRTVDAHVSRLRRKLEPVPTVPRHFLTIHGVGYRFVP